MMTETSAERVSLIDREISSLADDFERIRRDQRADFDRLRLEVETLKLFLRETLVGFDERWDRLAERARQEIHPE